MPLPLLLPVLELLAPVDSLLGADALEHLQDARHHSLESTEVDVSTLVQPGEDVVGVLLHLVLNVHLATPLVQRSFTGESIVKLELVWVSLKDVLPLVVVQEGILVGNTKEQPGSALVSLGGRGVLHEESSQERSVRSNTSSGGDHDKVGLRVLLRHKHDLARRTSDHDLVTRLGVAEVVGADTLLGRVLSLELRAPVDSAANTEGSSGALHVITVTGGGDRVETVSVWLSVLRVDARRDDAVALAFPVWHLALVIDHDVASLTGSLGSDDSLHRHNLADVGLLGLEELERNVGLVPVRLGLQEVLSLAGGLRKSSAMKTKVNRTRKINIS